MLEALINKIREVVLPIMEDMGLEMIEFSVNYRGKTIAIDIIIDYEHGGVSLEQCSLMNRQLKETMEEQQLIIEDYTIEVSSPGLDRPLKTSKDFKRAIGKNVRFHLRETIENKLEHSGIILEVRDGDVMIETKRRKGSSNGQFNIAVSLNKIQNAVQIA